MVKRPGAKLRRRPPLADRAASVAAGLVVDAFVGEPPRCHPVAGFGEAMTRLERRMWADDRCAGTRYAAVGIGGAAVAGVVGAGIGGTPASLVAATWLSSAGRCLVAAASLVADALDDGDLWRARETLPALVGRSTEGLDEKEIARAVVESLAENLSDAVVATAWWGVVAGTAGVLAHRAANTLDAMVGHRSPRFRRFGWAAARTDDVMGWPASRLTALLVALACPRRAVDVWRVVRRDAPHHPSPNAGVAEAAFAAALDLRLGGANSYRDGGSAERVEVRPALGNGRTPEPRDIRAAIALTNRVRVLLVLALLVLSAAGIGGSSRSSWPAHERRAPTPSRRSR
jgi:adenosylcobinamide-phosphate synthase